jgi:hypothetical protein
MQQHIHSTIASFGRTKGTRRRGEREREEEKKRGFKGGRGSSWEDDGWKAQTWEKCHQIYIDVNDINNCLHKTRWRRTDGKLIPGKKLSSNLHWHEQ